MRDRSQRTLSCLPVVSAVLALLLSCAYGGEETSSGRSAAQAATSEDGPRDSMATESASAGTCRQQSVSLQAGRIKLRMAGETSRIIRVADEQGNTLSRGEGGLYLFDGQSKMEIFPQRITDLKVTEGTASYSLSSGDPGVRIACSISESEGLTTWNVALTNSGKALRLIELRLGLPLAMDEQWDFWDGYDGDIVNAETRRCTSDCVFYACNAVPTVWRGKDLVARKRSAISSHRLGNVGIFPLNCVYTRHVGVALGVAPDRPLSYYAGGLQPSSSPRESFYYAVKLVIDPGRTEQCTFVAFGFDPTYGYRKAIDIYQRHFASTFRMRDGLDPRVRLPGTGTYLGFHAQVAQYGWQDLWREFCRRYYIGWTWLYAPFQRCGDFWPGADTFDVKHWSRPKPDSPKTFEEFQQKLVEGNRAVRGGCAIGYYVIPEKCEKKLAQTAYADSQVVTTDGRKRYGGAVTGWPLATMFPMKNSFGQNCEREFQQILQHAHADGIAFDNALTFYMHTGGGTMDCAGRAFTGDSVYVVNHLAYKYQMDRVRSTPFRTPDGFRPAVFSNGAYSIFAAQATDAGLIEYHPYPPSRTPGRFAALRYLLGPEKPIVFKVHGRQTPQLILNRQPSAPEEIDVQMNLRLHSLLALFRWGAYPRMREALGTADMIDALPVLVELHRAGWQPTNAVRGGEGLWIERFGSGTNTHLVIINPMEKPFVGTLQFDHKEADLGPATFERIYGQGELQSQAHDGRSTLRLTIAPVWLQVLRVRQRGKPSDEPVRFVPTDHAVLDLPYMAAGKLDLSIVLPERLPRAAHDCAKRIQSYFVYYQLAETFEKWYLTNGRTARPDLQSVVTPDIVSTFTQGKGKLKVVFSVDPEAEAATIAATDQNTLAITLVKADDCCPVTDRLLRLLDARYVRYGYDGLFNASPTHAGQLGPHSTLFRRHGWVDFLMLMQRRSLSGPKQTLRN